MRTGTMISQQYETTDAVAIRILGAIEWAYNNGHEIIRYDSLMPLAFQNGPNRIDPGYEAMYYWVGQQIAVHRLTPLLQLNTSVPNKSNWRKVQAAVTGESDTTIFNNWVTQDWKQVLGIKTLFFQGLIDSCNLIVDSMRKGYESTGLRWRDHALVSQVNEPGNVDDAAQWGDPHVYGEQCANLTTWLNLAWGPAGVDVQGAKKVAFSVECQTTAGAQRAVDDTLAGTWVQGMDYFSGNCYTASASTAKKWARAHRTNLKLYEAIIRGSYGTSKPIMWTESGSSSLAIGNRESFFLTSVREMRATRNFGSDCLIAYAYTVPNTQGGTDYSMKDWDHADYTGATPPEWEEAIKGGVVVVPG